MDLERVKTLMIEKNIAFLPGGKDRGGSRLILYPSQGQWRNQPYEDVLALTAYLAQMVDFSKQEQARHAFTVIVDMRNAWIRYLKTVLKAVQFALYPRVRHVLVIKPDQFLEKQRLLVDIILEAYEFKVQLISLHKLSRHFELSELPPVLGGTYPFEVHQWMSLRQRYEQWLTSGSKLMRSLPSNTPHPNQQSTSKTDNQPRRLDTVTVHNLTLAINEGESLVTDLLTTDSDEQALSLPRRINPEHDRAAHRIRTVLGQMKDTLNPPPPVDTEQQLSAGKLQHQFLLGVENMLDWFVNAGERWLLTLHEIGESKEDACQLVREHETLLSKSNEVSHKVHELNALADQLNASGIGVDTIGTKRDTLRSVSQTFLARVQRQLDMCGQSVVLHTDFVQHNRRMDALLESLCSEPSITDLTTAKMAVQNLEEQLQTIDDSQEQLLLDGRRFLDQLSVTEYNSQGHEITRDYVAGIVHVRQLLAHIVNRRKRCNDLADVRKLKLQQMLQLFTCEQDSDQAISWLHELRDTFERDMASPVDGTQEAIKQRRMQQSKLEHTARSTYDYGRQLSQTALVLRRSLRQDESTASMKTQQLEQAWAQFCRSLSENEARMNLSRVFHATAQQVGERLEELSLEVANPVAEGTELSPSSASRLSHDSSSKWRSLPDIQVKYGPAQRRLDGDVMELKHMAQMLTDGNEHLAKSNGALHIRSLLGDIEAKQQNLGKLMNEQAANDARNR